MKKLDDPEQYLREPYRRAFEIAGGFLEDLRRGIEAGESLDLEVGEVGRVLFLGVGGSGIVGDFARRLLVEAGVSASVSKDYRVVGGLDRDLVIAVSHSGNTAEVVKPALELASKLRDRMVFVTSGGVLAGIGERYGVPVARVRGDVPPRYAFPSMLGAVLGILSRIGLLKPRIDYSKLEEVQARVGEGASFEENPAKRIAARIAGGFPIVYAYEEVRAPGYRLKCQLNENAKMYCGFAELPEGFHNDVEALPGDGVVIFPRSFRERAELGMAIEAFAELVGSDRVVFLRAESGDGLGELLELTIQADYISLYASILRGSDPLSLPFMNRLKKLNKAYELVLGDARKRIGRGRDPPREA